LSLIHRPFIDDQPIITVLIGVSLPRRHALTVSGLPIPNLVTMRLLIDTGASCVALDQTAIASLGLVPTGRATVHTPSTDAAAPHFCNQYDVSLVLPAASERMPLLLEALPILEGAFRHQGIDGLLGRDVLAQCTLVYNAPVGSYTLAY
jgi:hypothetical protein